MTVDFAAAIENLKQRFLDRSATELDLLLDFQAGRSADGDGLKYIVHRLAGTAATLGFADVSAAATRLELHWRAHGDIDGEGLEALIAELRKLGAPEASGLAAPSARQA